MEWVWTLYEDYVNKQERNVEEGNASADRKQEIFLRILSESTVTVLVQEPWQNSVRFKGLAKYNSNNMMELLNDPMNFLLKNFGGGKFKLNFHHGWNFVATRNFKPQGEPKWKEMPSIDF
jgi:hypothetical protein